MTSNGYNWSGRFLAAYDKRRRSKDGQEMMGMIFRTDTNELLSQSDSKPGNGSNIRSRERPRPTEAR